MMKGRLRHRRNYKPGHERMRQGYCEKVGRALVDRAPDEAPRESDGRQPRIRQMQSGKNHSNEKDGRPSLSQKQHRAPVQEALENVLLRETPSKAEGQLDDQKA